MTRTFTSSPVTDIRADHGEGPCWDDRSNRLLWVDQYVGLVRVAEYAPSPARLVRVGEFDVGGPIGAIVPAASGGWMLAALDGFARLSDDGTVESVARPLRASARRMRMNDGKCAPDGSFWAGCMAWDKTPSAGCLYRLGQDLRLTTLLSDVTISNGLVWSADAASCYYIDTPTQRVDRFDVTRNGLVGKRTPVVTIPPDQGHPDGMAIDEEGCLWVALWNGWAVHRYSPAGELLATVSVDAPLVSSCCFGGPAGSVLFITTSQEDMDDAARERFPHSGQVFAADVGVRGHPGNRFGRDR